MQALHPIVDGGVRNVQRFADVHEGHASVLSEAFYDSLVDFVQLQTQHSSLSIHKGRCALIYLFLGALSHLQYVY